ncbi:carboxymuconolactone decarboxylase family protein [Kribbella rubisoli]|uniref:Carboxymuconolactone decarboxylase family protein n=1 Tax=Kribbella rubisoli TaxID=3075929 RepID=A0A4Q7X8Y6_9ACTN|nr:carboxymuconolactone decarboxylase family protein [Kribbella rubisoli]RZU19125.1 carboxymuconolactone decarboxylase family protein [Kribbella rubisoli]
MSDPTASDTPVLDLLERMTVDSVATSGLDVQSIALVRLAALVASGAPAVSYALNLAVDAEVGLNADDVRGVLAAIAPIVGTSRVAAATGRIALALKVAIDVASTDLEDDLDTSE